MKTWIKRTLIGIVGIGAVFGGIAACSHHRHHGPGWQAMTEADAAPIKAKLIEKAGSKLQLDDAQKAKLGVLADRLREQRNALVGSGADPRAELGSLVAGPAFDRAKARALVEAKTTAVQSQSPALIDAMADFYDSLKPEQQSQLREMMDRRRGWHRG